MVAVKQVRPADANERELCFFAQIYSIVAILQLGAQNTIVVRKALETEENTRTTIIFFFLFHISSIKRNGIDLLHVGSHLGVRWLVDLVPVNKHFDLFVEAEYDHAVLQISVGRGVADCHSLEVRY